MIKREIVRKTIHLFAIILLVPVIYLDKSSSIIIYLGIFFLMLGMEITRVSNIQPGKFIYNKLLFDIMRNREMPKEFCIKSADQMILGLLCLSIFFEPKVIIPSFLVLCIADTMAALIGVRYGKIRIYNGKSLEGSVAFFASCAYILFHLTEVTMLHVIIISLIATAIEMFDVYRRLDFDDNFIIPVSTAIMLTLI